MGSAAAVWGHILGCYSFGWFELLQGEDFVQGRSLSHDHVHWDGEVLFTRGGHYFSLLGIYLLSRDFPLRGSEIAAIACVFDCMHSK